MDIIWLIFSIIMFLTVLVLIFVNIKVRKEKNFKILFLLQLLTFISFTIYGISHLFENYQFELIKEVSESFAYLFLLLFGFQYFHKIENAI